MMLDQILKKREDLQHFLFIRGFLISSTELKGLNKYPFYSNWSKTKIGEFNFYIHNLQKLYTVTGKNYTYFLIGHAYNPFAMLHKEEVILESLAAADVIGNGEFLNKVDELTGIFVLGRIKGNEIRFLNDCSGMQYAAYGNVDSHFYIASHIQLYTDICKLQMDSYVKRLINYRWYKYMMGNYLPGDITPFSGIKRLIPNTYVDHINGKSNVVRFYPAKPLKMCVTDQDYQQVIKDASSILQKNMELIALKWSNPAISLTGGIDSNTTFAAANGNYHRFKTFSYVSMPREQVDAEAAGKISAKFNVSHTVYQVPEANEAVKDFELFKVILDHNAGKIGPTKDDDTRKKITLMQQNAAEVEVKSWISETIRAYAYKYFGRTSLPKNLRPRHYTSLYKIFFLNRRLVWETDRHFRDYMKNTRLKAHLFNYDESDFFVWEMMHGGKCGLNIGTMKFCFDITIPYNNRKFLDMVLRIPLEYRISDQHHMDMKRLLNPELYEMNIRVINLNETKSRKRMASIYFDINSGLPF